MEFILMFGGWMGLAYLYFLGKLLAAWASGVWIKEVQIGWPATTPLMKLRGVTWRLGMIPLVLRVVPLMDNIKAVIHAHDGELYAIQRKEHGYYQAPLLWRMAIQLGGVFAFFLGAFFMYSLSFYTGTHALTEEDYTYKAGLFSYSEITISAESFHERAEDELVEVVEMEKYSQAWEAGLEYGDKIVAVDNIPYETGAEVLKVLDDGYCGQTFEFQLRRRETNRQEIVRFQPKNTPDPSDPEGYCIIEQDYGAEFGRAGMVRAGPLESLALGLGVSIKKAHDAVVLGPSILYFLLMSENEEGPTPPEPLISHHAHFGNTYGFDVADELIGFVWLLLLPIPGTPGGTIAVEFLATLLGERKPSPAVRCAAWLMGLNITILYLGLCTIELL